MGLKRSLILLLCLFSISFYSLKGQDYTINYRNLGLPDGISHQQVNCFLQDSSGLMWIGTDYGLNRFDGKQFDTWTSAKDSLSNDKIHFLMEDKEGWIWAISTKSNSYKQKVEAISLIHSVTGEVQSFQQRISAHAPFELQDIDHFFSMPNRLLYFWAQNKLWKYEPATGFERQPCLDSKPPFSTADERSIWGTSKNTIVRFDTTGQILEQYPFQFNDYYKTLFGDQSGVWLIESGIPPSYFSVNGKATLSTNVRPRVKKTYYFDKKRKWLWKSKPFNVVAFDTLGRKVFDFQMTKGRRFDINVRTFFVDREGLVWLGTRKGVYIMELKSNRFKKYLHNKNGNSEGTVYRCRGLVEHEGKLFVNTYAGAMKVDLGDGKAQKLNRSNLFNGHKKHFPLQKAPDAKIWSASNYLSRIDGSSGKVLEDIQISDTKSFISSIHIGQNGMIWLTNKTGIYFLKEGKVYPFRAYNGFTTLEKSRIYYFHESKQGTIWLGTNNGLYLLDTQEGIIDHFWNKGKGDHYLPAKQIQHIYEDQEGYFWMATEHSGLLKWHPRTKALKQQTRTNGLPANTIYAVYEDKKGFLWISSNFGLIQMDKQTFRKKIYLPEDGISDIEFNRTSHYQADDGKIYFGGQNGVTAFDPSDFWEAWYKKEQSPLQIYEFTEGHDFGAKKLDAMDRLKEAKLLDYPHSVTSLSFRIKTPNFFLADKINYYYRIRSLDKSRKSPFSGTWTKNEGSTVNIIGMNPGKYELTIEAKGLDQENISQPFLCEIEIKEAFFRTRGFQLLLGLVILGGLLTFLRLRERNIIKQKQLLEKEVKLRTQQILKDQQIIHQQAQQIQQLDSLLNATDRRWAEELDGVVRQNFDNLNLNIADIANEMNLSRAQFFRKIKTITGFTPNQYLQEIRLMEAKRLFESGEYYTVKAVSFSVGFKKPSYFSSLFKERFGFSPSNYFNKN